MLTPEDKHSDSSKAAKQRDEFRRDMMERKKQLRLQAQKRKNDAITHGIPLDLDAPHAQLSGAAASGNILVLTPINKPPPIPAKPSAQPPAGAANGDADDLNLPDSTDTEPDIASARFSDDDDDVDVADANHVCGSDAEQGSVAFDAYAELRKFAAHAAAQHDDLQYSVLILQMQEILRIPRKYHTEKEELQNEEVDLMNMEFHSDTLLDADEQTQEDTLDNGDEDIEKAIPRNSELQDDDDEFEEEAIPFDEVELERQQAISSGNNCDDVLSISNSSDQEQQENGKNEKLIVSSEVSKFSMAKEEPAQEEDEQLPLITELLKTADLRILAPSELKGHPVENKTNCSEIKDNKLDRDRRLKSEELKEYLSEALGPDKVDSCLQLLLSASNIDGLEEIEDDILNRLEEMLGDENIHYMDDLMQLLMISMHCW